MCPIFLCSSQNKTNQHSGWFYLLRNLVLLLKQHPDWGVAGPFTQHFITLFVCFFHSSVCSVLLSFTKFCAVNDLGPCFFGRSKLFQSLSLGQPCVAQCPCIIGAKGLGERHCCHFDQISTNQPNRHHITSHRIVQCRRLRRGRGQLSVLSHDLRLGSAGHQVVCSFFVWFLNIRNRIVDNDVGVRSLCGRLDICRTPASTRPVGSVRPLQKVNLGFVDL